MRSDKIEAPGDKIWDELTFSKCSVPLNRNPCIKPPIDIFTCILKLRLQQSDSGNHSNSLTCIEWVDSPSHPSTKPCSQWQEYIIKERVGSSLDKYCVSITLPLHSDCLSGWQMNNRSILNFAARCLVLGGSNRPVKSRRFPPMLDWLASLGAASPPLFCRRFLSVALSY